MYLHNFLQMRRKTRSTRLPHGQPWLFICLLQFFIVFWLTYMPGHLVAQGFPHPLSLHAAYSGNNVWNPGLEIGIDRQRVLMDKSRNDHDFSVEKWFTGDLGFYVDPGSHSAAFLNVGLNRRKYKESMFYTHAGIDPIGIYRSILPETYEVTADGSVIKVGFPGNWYYAPTASWGFGKYYNRTSGSGWYTTFELMALLPYNTSIQFLLNLKLGYRLPMREITGI